jgi:hypothetical protein
LLEDLCLGSHPASQPDASDTYGSIKDWDTSLITNMDKLFDNKDVFAGDDIIQGRLYIRLGCPNQPEIPALNSFNPANIIARRFVTRLTSNIPTRNVCVE